MTRSMWFRLMSHSTENRFTTRTDRAASVLHWPASFALTREDVSSISTTKPNKRSEDHA
jgi:hypothetical protein